MRHLTIRDITLSHSGRLRGIMRSALYQRDGRLNLVDILNEATIVSYTGKKHEVLTRNQQDLLLLLGSRPAFPRSLLSAWNSHHRAANSEYVFAKTLLELIEDEYISVAKVVLEPKPRQYHGVFTVNPDGSATFVTDRTQFGAKLTLTLSGVELDSTNIVARIKAQSK